MTEHRDDDLTAAFHRLRATVRQQVPAPGGAALRAAATRQLRVRRTTLGVFAAAAVVAIAVGGAAVLQPAAAPPVSPADSASPAVTPAPLPQPPEPFADVDWHEVTIDLPEHDGCPSGTVEFVPHTEPYRSSYGPADGYPKVSLYADPVTYGDLTGDGRPEAVLDAYCATGQEESYDGEGQLLVVSHDPGGTLRALAWVGPRGASYQGSWVADGYLYVEAHPWHGETFEWTPGTALRYRWDGTDFEAAWPAPEFPSLVPYSPYETVASVRLGPVAAGLGCPDGTVQFDLDGTAVLDGATYDVTQPGTPTSGPHLLDLNQTGERMLVLAVECIDGAEVTGGLGIFEIGDGEVRGVHILVSPPSERVISWRAGSTAEPGWLRILYEVGPDAEPKDTWYEWNGTELQPTN